MTGTPQVAPPFGLRKSLGAGLGAALTRERLSRLAQRTTVAYYFASAQNLVTIALEDGLRRFPSNELLKARLETLD